MTTDTLLPSPKDRVEIPGVGEFEVIGWPDDQCHGPFWEGPIPMPTPYEVLLKVHQEMTFTDDGYGNQIDSWADPITLAVCGWQTPTAGNKEPGIEGHQRVVADLELLIPGYKIDLKRVEG